MAGASERIVSRNIICIDFAVSAGVSSLTPNTLYHFRVSGTNGVNTANGSDANFTTLSNAPTIGTPNSPNSTGFTANWNSFFWWKSE